jgi:hypothetical protein
VVVELIGLLVEVPLVLVEVYRQVIWEQPHLQVGMMFLLLWAPQEHRQHPLEEKHHLQDRYLLQAVLLQRCQHK